MSAFTLKVFQPFFIFHSVGLTLIEKGPMTLGRNEFEWAVSFLAKRLAYLLLHVVTWFKSFLPPVLGYTVTFGACLCDIILSVAPE